MDISLLPSIWFLPGLPVTPLRNSVWRVGDGYFLKAYDDRRQLEGLILLVARLCEQGLPVAEPMRTVDEADYLVSGGRCYVMTRRLPGAHLDPAERPEQAALFGRTAARLHAALAAVELPADDHDLLAELRALPDRIADHAARDAFREALDAFVPLYPALPRQRIHRDLHADNLLFKEGEATGYLDFDLSYRDARLFDLCYLASGWLCGRWQQADQAAIWEQSVRALFAAYHAHAPLTAAERRAAAPLLACINGIFTAFYSAQGQTVQAQEACGQLCWLWGHRERVDRVAEC